MVGVGPELTSLRELTNKLNLQNEVYFLGMRHGSQLAKLYERCHIAVGSLGHHRRGLSVAGEIKIREYTSIGIPFISTGFDFDFDFVHDELSVLKLYRFNLTSTEDPTSLVNFLANIDLNSCPSPALIREQGCRFLDINSKVEKILNRLVN